MNSEGSEANDRGKFYGTVKTFALPRFQKETSRIRRYFIIATPRSSVIFVVSAVPLLSDIRENYAMQTCV